MRTQTKRIFLEEIPPLLAPMAAVFVWYLTGFFVPETLDGIISAGLSFASISGGFLVTAWAIIISAGDKRLIKKLFESSIFYARFNRFFRHSVYSMLGLTIVSMAGFFVSKSNFIVGDWQISPRGFLTGLFIFVFILSASFAFRFGYTVYCVVNNALLDEFKQQK